MTTEYKNEGRPRDSHLRPHDDDNGDSRYNRNGPMSPFRSPLRPDHRTRDDLVSRKCRTEERRRHQDQDVEFRTRRRDRQAFTPTSDRRRERQLNSMLFQSKSSKSSDSDQLSTPLEMSPLKTKFGATDWGSIVEEEEKVLKDQENRVKRKMELSEEKNPEEGKLSQKRLTRPRSLNEDPAKFETDPLVLERRQKQIDYGYNTPEHKAYVKQVPRKERTKLHPWTPDKNIKYSRRGWDTIVKIWRKQLHIWDPKARTESGGDAQKEEQENLKLSYVCHERNNSYNGNFICIKDLRYDCMEDDSSSCNDGTNEDIMDCDDSKKYEELATVDFLTEEN